MSTSTTPARGQGIKILLLNPNSSESMTEAMMKVVDGMNLPSSIQVHTYTASSESPASINNEEDMEKSTEAVLKYFHDYNDYDGIVVACYSYHPLVHRLQAMCEEHVAIIGIFQASILTALSLCEPWKWGIVTTGKYWEAELAKNVSNYLGIGRSPPYNTPFAGVQSTGLNASDFHGGVDPAVIRSKLKEATKRLFESVGARVSVIVMGCAGMAGLEEIIREAACDEYGEDFAYSRLYVVDSVRAGIMQVEQMVKAKRLRPGRKV